MIPFAVVFLLTAPAASRLPASETVGHYQHPLRPGIHYYTIIQNEDDGTELNDSIWMPDGLTADPTHNYAGKRPQDYADVGLRFHLEDLNQGDQFVLARLRFITADARIDSGVRLEITGVNLDGVPAFSQDLRPSMANNLTQSSRVWEPAVWPVYHSPGGDYEDFPVRTPLYVFSPNIASIINEILARPGWGSGSQGKTLALLVENRASKSSGNNYIVFQDYYGSTGSHPPVILELYSSIMDTFIGGPVLSRPTADQVTATLIPQLMSDLYIEYGTAPGVYTDSIGASHKLLPAVDPLTNCPVGVSKALVLNNLAPNTRYYYRLRARRSGLVCAYKAGPEYSFTTQRSTGEPFTFAFLSDSHIGMKRKAYSQGWDMGHRAVENAMASAPDFFIIGGDDGMTYEGKGLYAAQSPYDAELRYSLVRHFYGPLASSSPIFLVLGNHEGEGGYYDMSEFGFNLQSLSLRARKKYVANPTNLTYPFGGGFKDNYYAWEWGDALFVVIDPFTHTGPEDPASTEPYGSAWTLGPVQLSWLESVLSGSQARWKFIFSHHILASYAKDGYAHGGAKYAHDWEQGLIHQMMGEHGAQIFFYGHDHVFADGKTDGIHYTCAAMCTGVKPVAWATNPDSDTYPYFVDAYPYGFFAERGHVRVKVGPRSVWVDFIRSALDDSENGEVIYGYHLADVTVELAPASIQNPGGRGLSGMPPQMSIEESGGMGLTGMPLSAVFTNHRSSPQTVDSWIRVVMPGDQDITYSLQENLRIEANASLKLDYHIFVPPHAGTCTIIAEVGEYPDQIISTDTYTP